MNGFLLVPSAPFVSHQCSTSVPGGSVAPGSHLNDFADPGSGLSHKQQNHLIPLKGGMFDHVIDGFVHALLHGIRLQDDLWLPNLPAPLAKIGRASVGKECRSRWTPTH